SRPRLSSRAQLDTILPDTRIAELRSAGQPGAAVPPWSVPGAYIVSGLDRRDLLAYWKENSVKHECSCIADVDGGQLCYPAEARASKAISPGADAGAAVSLQPGLRRLRQDSVSGACAQAPAVARGVLP